MFHTSRFQLVPEEFFQQGKVYIAGAGPGDPFLVSLKTLALIQQSDVIIYDYLANPKLLECAKNGVQLIYVGKKAGNHTLSQDDINSLLIDYARNNLIVLRLKGGDPFVFGRGGEEALICQENQIPFEIIPGITSSIAAPAYCGIPVTQRNIAVTFAMVTGHESEGKTESQVNWKALSGIDTVAIYMGVKNLSFITEKFLSFGRSPDTPAAIIQWGTFPNQKLLTGTLKTLPELAKKNNITPPSMIIIGDVVDYSKTLNWYETLPLYGKKILVTRTRKQAGKLSTKLSALGAIVTELPTIEIVPPTSSELMRNTIKNIKDIEIAVFTSENGVDSTFQTLFELGYDIRHFSHLKFASIGPATSLKLKNYYIKPDYQAKKFVAESLFEEMKENISLSGKKIVLFRSEQAREFLKDELISEGAHVIEVPVYNTISPNYTQEYYNEFLEEKPDIITFTSSSTVKNFFSLPHIEEYLDSDTCFASIGPVTSETLIQSDKNPHIEAEIHTIQGLIDSIVNYYCKKDIK